MQHQLLQSSEQLLKFSYQQRFPSFFAKTTLSNTLLIAGGREKSVKRTNQILTIDAGQLCV